MTTIAYKDGVMAADSLVTVNGMRAGAFTKVFDYQSMTSGAQVLIGFCGEPRHIAQAMAEVVNRKLDPLLSGSWPVGEYTALIAIKHEPKSECPPDIYLFEGAGHPYPIQAPYQAIGSGSEVATGAMAMGATALQAVKTAIDLDTGSGGPAVSISFSSR